MTTRKNLSGDDRKGLVYHLTTVGLVLGIAIGLTATAFVLFSVVWSLLGHTPWLLKLLVGFIIIVLIFAATGTLASQVELPHRWLLAIAAGALIALSPLLMLWIHGSWGAIYQIPSRSAHRLSYSVAQYSWFAVVFGLTVMVSGATGFVRSCIKHRRGQKPVSK